MYYRRFIGDNDIIYGNSLLTQVLNYWKQPNVTTFEKEKDDKFWNEQSS